LLYLHKKIIIIPFRSLFLTTAKDYMKSYIMMYALFLFTFTKTMEQQSDPLALIVNKYNHSEISYPKNSPLIHHNQTHLTNNLTNNSSFIQSKKLHIYNYINALKTNNKKLILIIKDTQPSNRIDKPIPTDPKPIINVSSDHRIAIPSKEIIYAALERYRYGYMAMITGLPYVLGGKELTIEAIADCIKTALHEYSNLYSPEELEYHTNKIVQLIITISQAKL